MIDGAQSLARGLACALTVAMLAARPIPALADTASASVSADGAYRELAVSTGATTHYSVLYNGCNPSAWLSSSTPGARDSYRLTTYNVPAGATITAIELQPCAAALTAGGSAQLDVFTIVGGVQSAYAGGYVLTNTNAGLQAWTSFTGLSIPRLTTSTIDVGVRYGGGTSGVKLTGLSARLIYTAPVPFTAPSGLSAIDVSANEIQLSWLDNTTTETGFRVERSLNGTNAWSLITTTAANTTSYRDNRLTADNDYYYRVQAQNVSTGQASGFSNTADAITYASVPSAPRNVYLTLGPASVTLSWIRLGYNDEGVAIERSTDGASYAEVARTGPGRTSYTDPVDPSLGTYHYRLRSFNAVGYSPYSNVAANGPLPAANGPDLHLALSAQQTSQGTAQLTRFSVGYSNVGTDGSTNAFISTTVPAGSTFDVASSSPEWRCHHPGADYFLLQTNLGNALRAIRVRYPNVQQVFVSSQMYSGYAVTAGVVEPWAYEGSFAVKAAVEAQIKQLRTGAVDALVGDLDYRTGRAPWVAQGPFLWANGTTPNGQGLYYLPSDFGSDMSHPSVQGATKLAGYMLNYFLSAPYTAWFRNQSDAPRPILPVAPLATMTPLIDLTPSQRYLGLSGGLYPDGSNTIPSDHLAAGLDAATRIQPLDANGNPSPSGKVVFLGLGFSNSGVVMNGFIPLATADARVKTQDRTVAPTGFRIVNGAVGGGVASTWADPTNGNYDVARNNLTGLGYSEKQVQAVWLNAANNAGPAIATALSGTAAGTLCKLPISSIPAGTSAAATFVVRTTATQPTALSLSANVVDDGATGFDLTPSDNVAELSFTVTP